MPLTWVCDLTMERKMHVASGWVTGSLVVTSFVRSLRSFLVLCDLSCSRSPILHHALSFLCHPISGIACAMRRLPSHGPSTSWRSAWEAPSQTRRCGPLTIPVIAAPASPPPYLSSSDRCLRSPPLLYPHVVPSSSHGLPVPPRRPISGLRSGRGKAGHSIVLRQASVWEDVLERLSTQAKHTLGHLSAQWSEHRSLTRPEKAGAVGPQGRLLVRGQSVWCICRHRAHFAGLTAFRANPVILEGRNPDMLWAKDKLHVLLAARRKFHQRVSCCYTGILEPCVSREIFVAARAATLGWQSYISCFNAGILPQFEGAVSDLVSSITDLRELLFVPTAF